jgi:hypothetical protein
VWVVDSGQLADAVSDGCVGLLSVRCCGRGAGQLDLGRSHHQTEHSAKRSEEIGIAESATGERFDEAFGRSVALIRDGPASQNQWYGIGMAAHGFPDGDGDGFDVGEPIS